MGKGHTKVENKVETKVWNEDGKFIENTGAALRPFPGSKHISINTRCVCEEEK